MPDQLSDRDTAPLLSLSGAVLTPQQEQQKWLAEAVQAVTERAAHMRAHASLSDGFVPVLQQASLMLAELRTGVLSPPNYYELYVRVFDELQFLEAYLREDVESGRHTLEELYEIVQYTGNIVPRLYLLITSACVYMSAGDQPSSEIMRDLVEMCKGVQHPTRGLFLRHFLLTVTKGRLPGDMGVQRPSGVDEVGAPAVLGTAQLLMQNLKEMTWLWIRMEARAFSKGPRNSQFMQVSRRSVSDRRELRVLVGMNIVRVSQLEGVDRDMYRSEILPCLLDIVVQHREPIAQQYLLEVIIQVFPDDLHLYSLDVFIGRLQNLSASVDVCETLRSLMERLGNYAVSLREGATEEASHDDVAAIGALFDTFHTLFGQLAISHTVAPLSDRCVKKTTTAPPLTPMPVSQYIHVMQYLCKLTLLIDNNDNSGSGGDGESAAAAASGASCYANVSKVLEEVSAKLAEAPEVGTPAAEAAEALLLFIIGQVKMRDLLDMRGGLSLLSLLPFKSRRAVALAVGKAAIEQQHRISTLEEVAQVLELIGPILYDQEDAPVNTSLVHTYDATAEFLSEQRTVCCVLHLIHHPHPAVYLKMLTGVRKALGIGGQFRIPHTLPALASLYVRAALLIHKDIVTAESGGDADGDSSALRKLCAKAFHYLHSGDGKGILEVLSLHQPVPSFYTYLSSANAADSCQLPDVTYTLLIEAFTVYEENAAEMRVQMDMLSCLINSLYALRNMDAENYDIVATKACQYCSKLMHKRAQSHMVALCANLFAKAMPRDAPDTEEGAAQLAANQQRVSECLQRATRIASHVTGIQQFALYVDLLNVLLQLYARKSGGCVTAEQINDLLDTLREVNEAVRGAAGGGAQSRSSSDSDNDNDNDERRKKTSKKGKNGKTANRAGEVRQFNLPQYESIRDAYRNATDYIRSRAAVDPKWEAIEA